MTFGSKSFLVSGPLLVRLVLTDSGFVCELVKRSCEVQKTKRFSQINLKLPADSFSFLIALCIHKQELVHNVLAQMFFSYSPEKQTMFQEADTNVTVSSS